MSVAADVGCERAMHHHESADERLAREQRIGELLRAGPPRDLTRTEFVDLLPPRNPMGCPQNWIRGKVIQLLNRRGYTVDGRWCK